MLFTALPLPSDHFMHGMIIIQRNSGDHWLHYAP